MLTNTPLYRKKPTATLKPYGRPCITPRMTISVIALHSKSFCAIKNHEV